MSSSTHIRVRIGLGLMMVALLSACDIQGIGHGNRIETLTIQKATATGLFGNSDNTAYLCFSDKLVAVGTFTDGGQADYSSRGHWTSSNPAVIKVSNGDIQLPTDETLAFASGSIIPVAEGTATISVDFVGLHASYDVTVKPIESLTLNQSSITLAPETSTALSLSAQVAGYEINATNAAAWSFDTPDDAVASIGAGTGKVTAIAVGGPLTARAELPLCPSYVAAQGLTATVNVAVPESLSLEREFTDAPNGELVVGTTEALKVAAHFADGNSQDLSLQVPVSSDNVDAVVSLGVLPNYVSAPAAGQANLTAVYGGDDGINTEGDTDPPEVSSNVLSLTAVERTLDSISITPKNSRVTALGTIQLEAIGSYDNGAATQPVTRSVTWASSDTSIVTAGSGLLFGGIMQSQKPEDGAVTITATYGSGDTALTDETALCVSTPGAPVTGECSVPETP
ncbi:Ig-like domain-containing protein [Sinimarinibacterium sp. CAU 1509]|uniref:Ig-like domain-containing protein n=1 Tax=Sinimarinibacterium sp. CAU 1509 TaxID=2562283 RepID=UPI00146D4E4C|nr:Ig-like domain-containing protein [Sinimarinibacterium sp. CAU 1509]